MGVSAILPHRLDKAEINRSTAQSGSTTAHDDVRFVQPIGRLRVPRKSSRPDVALDPG